MFVKRQIKGSGKTYSKSMTFNEIAKHAEKQMEKNFYKEGYRRVRIVQVAKDLISDFICPYVKINQNTRLVSKLVKRQSFEELYSN